MQDLSVDELRALSMKLGQVFDHEKKDLETYAIGARTVIQLALNLAEKHSHAADQYKNIALFTSYNLAAGCWPAWDEASFAVAEAYLDLGLECANFNVELAAELAVGPERKKNGTWIKGAHLACRGQFAEAKEAFAQSEAYAAEAGDGDAEMMARGWVLLMLHLQGDETAAQSLETLKVELGARGEDGEFYASQYDPLVAYLNRSAT